jgi:hypothetical protein
LDNNSDYDAINFYYYENGWNKLKTAYIFDDQTYYYYEAAPSKLTYFAISGEKKAALQAKAIKQEVRDNNSSANLSIAQENSELSKVNKENSSLLNLFFSEKRNTYLFISGLFLLIILLSVFAGNALKGGYYENTDEIHKLIEEEMGEGIPKKDIEQEIISNGWPKSLVDKIVHSEKLPHAVDIKLKSYIQSMRNKMFSDEQIKKALLKEGWPQETVDDLIKEFTE